jgi:hypothetical protein
VGVEKTDFYGGLEDLFTGIYYKNVSGSLPELRTTRKIKGKNSKCSFA